MRSPDEILTDWTLIDVMNAHAVLDMYAELEVMRNGSP